MSLRSFAAWMGHMIHNDKILLHYRMDPRTQRFQKDMSFARVSEAQAYGMGYQRGVRMLDEMKYGFFKTYVKFSPDVAPEPPAHTDDDGNVIVCRETSSTLYDHWRSDAQEKFLSGMMTKKQLTPNQMKKLLMIGVIAAAAAAGVLLIMR